MARRHRRLRDLATARITDQALLPPTAPDRAITARQDRLRAPGTAATTDRRRVQVLAITALRRDLLRAIMVDQPRRIRDQARRHRAPCRPRLRRAPFPRHPRRQDLDQDLATSDHTDQGNTRDQARVARSSLTLNIHTKPAARNKATPIIPPR